MPAVTPFFKGLYEFTITSSQGDTTVMIDLQNNNQEFRFGYQKTPDGVIVDPDNWVLNLTGTITDGGIIIPPSIVMLSGGQVSACTALLLWNVANENNITRYEAEFSTDGIVYTKFGERPAANLNTDVVYTIEHPLSASGIYHYRIKIIEPDGSIRYSNAITIGLDCGGSAYSIRVGPVPTNASTNVYITLPDAGNTSLTLFNSRGQLLYQEIRALTAGENIVPLKVMNRVAAGIYFLTIRTAGQEDVSIKILHGR
jgi:hypothetical protein